MAYTRPVRRTRPCTRLVNGRVHGPCTQPCMYTGVHVHGPRTRQCTGRAVHTAVYTAVSCTRPSTRLCTSYKPCIRSCACVHGLYMAVCTACARSCTRMHGLYTKPIQFATFSLTVVITSVNNAKHHIACHRKFINYGVKRDLK